MNISERYKKALVTVAMGLRTEDDIKKNGLMRFCKSEKQNLISFATKLFNKTNHLLALKIKPTGFRSEHINISNVEDFNSFVENIDTIFDSENEIWIVSSSAIDCWRCRIYLDCSLNNSDIFEMAYSNDDHILDHITNENKKQIQYISFVRNGLTKNFEPTESYANEQTLSKCKNILTDIFNTYNSKFISIKKDMQLLNVSGISLDCRVNNGYDFHDFDVSYGEVKNIIDFYFSIYLNSK